MKDIREVYPDCIDKTDGYWWGAYSYQPMIHSLGYKILLQIDDHDYQGDSRLLFQNGDQYGYLIFGWGSCSGCDALQGAQSYLELEHLRLYLYENIQWDTKENLFQYIKNKDWELEWSWHSAETQKFINEALKLLE